MILLLYNGWYLGHARLGELYRFIPHDCEVIVVDNGSDDPDVQKGLEWWKGIHPPHENWLKIITLPENLGFTKGFNVGIDAATGRYIMCLSSDVTIYRPFAQEIVATINEDDKMLVGGKIIDWRAGWNEVGKYVIPYLEGWMIAATRRGWETLGNWDERYSPYDFEDVDLSMEALSLGFTLTTVTRGLFNHQGGGSFTANLISGDERRVQTLKNQQKFLEKWEKRIPEIMEKLSEGYK